MIKREIMMSHAGDARCVCTDGREDERDVAEYCMIPIEELVADDLKYSLWVLEDQRLWS